MSGEASFSTRTVVIIAVILALSFVGSLVLMVFSDHFKPDSIGADSRSRSALGHSLFAETMEELDIEVIRSSAFTVDQVVDGDLLVIAEPLLLEDEPERALRFAEMVYRAEAVLVVLPKREGAPDEKKKTWIGDHRFVAESQSELIFDALEISAEVVRRFAYPQRNRDGDSSDNPTSEWEKNVYGIEPVIEQPQLMRTTDLDPLIESEKGILLGRSRSHEGRLFVLSDPDLLANHGLDDGRNLELLFRIVQELREGDAAIVLDESLHGVAAPESLWAALLSYPLILATLTAIFLLAALLWRTMGRFGEPAKLALELGPGKGYLIANTARLLALGGHSQHTLRQYFKLIFAEVRHTVTQGRNVSDDDSRELIERLETARNTKDSLVGLEQEFAKLAVKKKLGVQGLKLARRMHIWREEMIHGSRVDQRRK